MRPDPGHWRRLSLDAVPVPLDYPGDLVADEFVVLACHIRE